MGWFSRSKESAERKALREEFDATMKLLAGADELRQVEVGHSINLVTSIFATRYPSIDTFEAVPRSEQLKYLESLTAMERELNAKQMGAGLGVGLFKMWLGAVVAQDEPLVQGFSEALARLSAKAVSVREAGGA
jgi:hypothetical protein